MPGFKIGSDQSIDGPSNKVELHRQHRWKISSIGIPIGAGSQFGSGTNTSRTVPHDRNNITFYAHSIQLPQLSFEEERILGGSVYYKIAKKAIWNDVTIKFYDLYGTYKIFKEWQDKIWDPQRGIKWASDYKGTVILQLTDGQNNTKQQYTLNGAYVKDVQHGDLSYSNTDIKLVTVIFAYDFADVDLSQDIQTN